MKAEIDITEKMLLARPPTAIVDTVYCYKGTAATSTIRTGNWRNLQQWYARNRSGGSTKVFAICDDEPINPLS